MKMCERFANDSVDTHIDYYTKTRNQDNPEAIKHQIEIGKRAEFAVWEILKDKITISKPDLTIYAPSEKSHGADLGKNIHIKSCDYSKDPSWVYQATCWYKYKGKHYFAMVEGKEVCILYAIKGENLQGLYDDPYKPELIGDKTCIYHRDLIELPVEKFIYKGVRRCL